MPNAPVGFGLPLHNLETASLLSCVSVYYFPLPGCPGGTAAQDRPAGTCPLGSQYPAFEERRSLKAAPASRPN